MTNIRFQYQEAGWLDKGKILDGFVAASGYDRKYAIKLLNSIGNIKKQPQTRQSSVKYDAQVKQALVRGRANLHVCNSLKYVHLSLHPIFLA